MRAFFGASIWGLAAIYAYRAYGDPTSLQHAQSMWGQLSMYLVTTEDAASGTHPFGGANISSICNGGKHDANVSIWEDVHINCSFDCRGSIFRIRIL